MRVKKDADSEHGPRHVTSAGRSVFYDLFPAEKAAEMEMRAMLLMGLEHWLEKSRMTQAEAAKVLGVTQARVSDLRPERRLCIINLPIQSQPSTVARAFHRELVSVATASRRSQFSQPL